MNTFTMEFPAFFFLSLFIYFEREREGTSRGGAERGRKRESQAGSALSAQSLTRVQSLKPQDHDLSQNQESDA